MRLLHPPPELLTSLSRDGSIQRTIRDAGLLWILQKWEEALPPPWYPYALTKEGKFVKELCFNLSNLLDSIDLFLRAATSRLKISTQPQLSIMYSVNKTSNTRPPLHLKFQFPNIQVRAVHVWMLLGLHVSIPEAAPRFSSSVGANDHAGGRGLL